MSPARPTAAAVIIGNEVLSAKVRDENTPHLAERLRALGVRLQRVVVIEDVVAEIAREVGFAADHHTHVFTSGGIGPTHDDVTYVGVAAAFGRSVEPHPDLVAALESVPPGPRREALLRLTLIPAGATLVRPEGADRALHRWPIIRMENVWIFPGVPSLFQAKLAAIAELIRGPAVYAAALYCAPQEPDITLLIDQVVAASPDVEIGSYPEFVATDFRTKLTIDGATLESVERAILAFGATLPAGAIVRIERTP